MQSNRFADTRDFLSQTKFYEGYSRFKENDGSYESWDEAVDRVISMHENNYSDKTEELNSYFRRSSHRLQGTTGAWSSTRFTVLAENN